jgi:hypothetical protein
LREGTGTQVIHPSLQLGSDGEPVVAYLVMETSGTARALHVRRWTGEAWSPVAPPLTAQAWCPQLRLDPSGRPVVAFLSRQEFPASSIAVYRWSGEAWESLTETLQIGPAERGHECPRLALGPEEEPLVASVGYDRFGHPSTDTTHVHVHRWTGSGWEQLGAQLNTQGAVSGLNTLALRMDSKGRPVVAWAEWTADRSTFELRVARWETGSWHVLGGAQGERVYAPELVVDAEDRPVVAWVQQPYSSIIYFAASAATDTAQAGLVGVPGALRVARLEGERWVSLGGEVRARSNVDGVGGTSLTIDARGTPWMAWREAGDTDIFIQLARWTGRQWELVAHDLRASSHYNPNGPNPASPSLEVDALGRLVLTWEEGLLHVRRAVR